MEQTNKPFMSEMRERLDRYASEVQATFSGMDSEARDKVCEDLTSLARFEGIDLATALKARHPRLLDFIDLHQHGRRG